MFIENIAATCHGGAILSDNSILSVHESVFRSNRATQGGGGAVFWTADIPSLDIDCIDNSAVYGDCTASDPQHFHVAYGSPYSASVSQRIPRPKLESSYVYITDHYNQTIGYGPAEEVMAAAEAFF